MNIQLVYNGIFRTANELMKKRKNEKTKKRISSIKGPLIDKGLNFR